MRHAKATRCHSRSSGKAGRWSAMCWPAWSISIIPDMIVIGGGVSNLGNLLLSSIRQAVLGRSLPLATRDLQIVFSEIGSDAGVLGAVSLAMEYIFTVEAGYSSCKQADDRGVSMKFGVNTFVWVSPLHDGGCAEIWPRK